MTAVVLQLLFITVLLCCCCSESVLVRKMLAKREWKRPGKHSFDHEARPSATCSWALFFSQKYDPNVGDELAKNARFLYRLPLLPAPATINMSSPVPQRVHFPKFHYPSTHSGIIPSFPAKVPSAWCIANSSMDDTLVREAMEIACSFGGADCRPIEPGNGCFKPDTLQAHASYVFNSYWQNTKHLGGTCTFDGAAMLTSWDPSYQGCTFEYRD